MGTVPAWISAEEKECVVEIGVVDLDGDVVDPRGEAMGEPVGWIEWAKEEGSKRYVETKTHHSGYTVDLKTTELLVMSLLNRLDQPFPSTCPKVST